MTVYLCAWCQEEGKNPFMRSVPDGKAEIMESHGACQAHADAILREAEAMWRGEKILNSMTTILNSPLRQGVTKTA